MEYLFDCCYSLSSIPDVSKLNTNNVTNMHKMFYNCTNNNVTKMDEMFYGCSSLSYLPDISKWNIEKVSSMKDMFNYCKKDLNIPKNSYFN